MAATGYTSGDPEKVDVTGDTMTGPLVLSGSPTADLQAATKKYVDDNLALKLPLAGGTLTGSLNVSGGSSNLTVGGMSAFTKAMTVGDGALSQSVSLISSRPSDDVQDGIDGTSRINLESYQRAHWNLFGESIRIDLKKEDAKAMIAWRAPSGGYDANGDPIGSMQTVTWIGSHWQANDHNSNHVHWEIEIPDSTGALQGRFEIGFADPVTGVIGLDKTNIKTNLSDFTVRCTNGQMLRLSATNSHEKAMEFSLSSDGESTYRRWKIGVLATTADFRIARYDDNGIFQDSTFFMERSTGRVGIGGTTSPLAQLHVVRSTGQVLFLEAQASNQSAMLVGGLDATVKALQAEVTGDAEKRFQVLVNGEVTWGPGNATRDTNLYRSAANVLKTDDKFIAGLGIGVGNSALASTGVGSLVRKIEVFDVSGASLGFIPVYSSIT